MKRNTVYLILIALAALAALFPGMALASASIQAQIEPGLSVDAVVVLPELPDGQAQVIRVALLEPDPQQLANLLYPGASIQEKNELPGQTIIAYADGTSLYASQQLWDFSTPLGNVIQQLRSMEALLDPQALELPDLDFASRQEAIASVQEILAAVGAQDARCVAAYALPQDWLQRYSDQMMGRPYNAEAIRDGRIPNKAQWTQADQCYWLRFEWAYSSIPVFAHPRLSIQQSEIGNYFPGSSLDAVVSAQGIQLLRGEDMLQEVSRDPAQPLLSADQVVDLLRDRYSNLIIDAPTTVKEIALMYVIRRVPDQEEALQLIPAWCCQVVREYGPEDVDEDWLAFDARDGQILF